MRIIFYKNVSFLLVLSLLLAFSAPAVAITPETTDINTNITLPGTGLTAAEETAQQFSPENLREGQDISFPLSLFDAIMLALSNNPTVRAMTRSLDQSEYLKSATLKEWLPVLSTDYSFTGMPRKLRMELGGFDGDDGDSAYPLCDRTFFLWGVHAKMPIYTFGVLEHKRSIAKLGVNVSEVRLLEARADLVQEVTVNYFNILRLRNYLKVVTENLLRFMKHEEMTRDYFFTGLVAKNALLEIQAKRANAQQDLIVVEKELKIAHAVLNVSMGVDIDSSFHLEDIGSCEEVTYSVDECFCLAQLHNPSLVAFSYLKERARKVIKLERTGTLPKIFGKISYYKHGKTPELAGDDYLTNDIILGVVSAEWNVFDWFKTDDLTKARKMELEQLIQNQIQVEDMIKLDIRESYLDMEAARNKFKVAQKGIEYAEENYRISRLRYEQRVAKATEVNDALVLLRKSQFNYYTAFFEYNVALARLERVIGSNIEFYYG